MNIVKGNDGHNHVRVSPYAKTKLGKLASLEWETNFFVPQLGNFKSPAGFLRWIKTSDEDARVSSCKLPYKGEGKTLQILLVAKYCQLAAVRRQLAVEIEANKDLIEIPWLVYYRHASGVVEFPPSWLRVGGTLKQLTIHIFERGPKAPFIDPETEFEYPRVLEEVIKGIKDWSHDQS